MPVRGRLVAAAVALFVVAGGGYLAADVADVVPGPLTARPLPAQPPPFPTAPGAQLPQDPAAAVLDALDPGVPAPEPARVGELLAPVLADQRLGPAVSASVVDVLTGEQLADVEAGTAREPASVAKLLTSAAALKRLGPASQVVTRAVRGAGPDEVVLVSGGDVLMSGGAGDPTSANGRAGLGDLAAGTAAALAQAQVSAVVVGLDDSVFTGPAMGPGWAASDVSNGFVAPVSGVAVDAGRTERRNYAPRVADPALAAAQTFADQLALHGVAVAGPVERAVAPAAAPVLAEVRSAPLAEVVGYVLASSDNNGAEALARLVARDAGRPATFSDAAGAVLDEVAGLGVDVTAATLADGSGLADGSSLSASLLTELLRVAAAPEHPGLRSLLTGLPVAGLDGTLAQRFAEQVGAGGLVRAKTGSLTGTTSLAGTLVDADGRLLAFAVVADRVPVTGPSREAVDAAVALLLECGCR